MSLRAALALGGATGGGRLVGTPALAGFSGLWGAGVLEGAGATGEVVHALAARAAATASRDGRSLEKSMEVEVNFRQF